MKFGQTQGPEKGLQIAADRSLQLACCFCAVTSVSRCFAESLQIGLLLPFCSFRK